MIIMIILLRGGEIMRNRKKNLNIHCGDIWMCDLKKMSGSVQFGYRPVFILSNNVNNMYANTLNIIPLTTKTKRKLPVHVVLWDYQKYGLKAQSTMLIEQIMTIPISDLDYCIGNIENKDVLKSIADAIAVQFSIY